MTRTQQRIKPKEENHALFVSSPALLDSVSSFLHKKQFAREDRIVSHGDPANALWLVYNGWVKLSRQTPDGKETIIGLCTEGEVFGEASLFSGASYPYNAEVIGNNAELASIAATDLRAAINKEAIIANNIMAMMSRIMSQAQLKLEHMNTMSAAQRLGCFLLRLCHTQADGKKILHIPIEKNILATYLGMKPETLSRSQQQLKPIGISVAGADITVENIASLRDFVCGSCSESGSCDAEDAAS